MNYLLDLRTLKIRFYFRAKTQIYLPQYKGATFRGTFGHTFKKVACTTSLRDCSKCPLSKDCVYFYVFETPFEGGMGSFTAPKAPQPFIVEPPPTDKRNLTQEEQFYMDLVLIGRAINYLPYFIYTFEEMGKQRKIGKYTKDGFGRFKLESGEVFDSEGMPVTIYENGVMYADKLKSYTAKNGKYAATDNTNLLINFITPTRIKHKGSLVELGHTNHLTFDVLVQNIFRRAYLLYYSHQSTDIPAFEEISVEFVKEINKNFHWKDIYHFSNRSKRRVPTGGFFGSVMYEDGWQKYYPLIKLGEKIHIGKETTFGLGKYIATELPR